LAELAGEANFTDVTFCAPATETRFAALIGADILSKEHEPTPDAPHTVILEAAKPAQDGRR
jgi:hypothetical protein